MLQVFINLATNEKNMEMFGDVGGFPPLIKLLHHPVFSMDAMPFLIALLNNRTFASLPLPSSLRVVASGTERVCRERSAPSEPVHRSGGPAAAL